MPSYVKRNDRFELHEPLYRACPHCQAHAELLPVATPSFDVLAGSRPRHVGVVFECAACKEPRFARLAVRGFEADRIVLSSNVVEIEKPRERFQFNYLPEALALMLRESFDCYTADLHTAFGVMCRRAVQAAMADKDSNNGARLPDLYREVVELAEIDYDTSQLLHSLLFDTDSAEPSLGPEQAAVLIEVVRDLFYQCYVRRAKLRAAVRMRRFFADETARNVASIESAKRRANSA